jgi:hypothetical protein
MLLVKTMVILQCTNRALKLYQNYLHNTFFTFNLAFTCHFFLCKSSSSQANWALWYKNGRFASHHYFKCVVHNMIMRKSANEKGTFIIKQELSKLQRSLEDRSRIQNGDYHLSNKIIYLSSSLRGTTQYWVQRAKDF